MNRCCKCFRLIPEAPCKSCNFELEGQRNYFPNYLPVKISNEELLNKIHCMEDRLNGIDYRVSRLENEIASCD